MMEITSLKQTEQALQEAEAKYHSLVEQIPAAVYTTAIDEQSTRLYISPQIEKLSGYTQMSGLPILLMEQYYSSGRSGDGLAKHLETNRTGGRFLWNIA